MDFKERIDCNWNFLMHIFLLNITVLENRSQSNNYQ